MRKPERSASTRTDPGATASRNVEPPKPNSTSSTASAPESNSMSRPVMPRSRVPSPT